MCCDANGNIIAEYKQGINGAKTLRYSYVYDELNQLVRVNDKVSNTTYTYTYDGAGNIVSKAEYIYTTDETITDEPEKVVNYTYDTVWKDKLATYDGKEFTYDNIGNPLTFDGASFTWMGRELTQYTKDGKEITFKYDENGLRHRKIVKENDVVVEQYDYVWSDGSLISQTYTSYTDGVATSDTAKFIYDSWGTLQGFILNNSETYLYVKNLQGDIIAIVDEFGEVIVEYSYDAWGQVTFHETSLQNMTKASTLCFVSPFTYRGYCYDYDIELYYLQSRYYSAEIGRFINADTYIDTGTGVLGMNMFAYCENNAVNRIDKDGFASIKLSDYKLKNWLQKLAKKIYNVWKDGQEYKLVNLSFAGIRFYISFSVATTLGKLKHINIDSNSITLSAGSISLTVGKTLYSYSVSTSIGANDVEAKYMFGSKYWGYGISLISNFKNSKGKTLWYASLNLVWRISHVTTLGATALCATVAVLAPVTGPIIKGAYSAVLKAMASYKGFITSLGTMVTIMQRIPLRA